MTLNLLILTQGLQFDDYQIQRKPNVIFKVQEVLALPIVITYGAKGSGLRQNDTALFQNEGDPDLRQDLNP